MAGECDVAYGFKSALACVPLFSGLWFVNSKMMRTALCEQRAHVAFEDTDNSVIGRLFPQSA